MNNILDETNKKGEKTHLIQQMFNRIAPSYDRLNMLMTFGMFHSWRKKALNMLEPFAPKEILDVATGTGDLAIDLVQSIASTEHVLGVDISEEMMRIGRDKVHKLGIEDKVTFERGDCTDLSFSDDSFDAVTIAYGVRNFENILQALKEVQRVLRPSKPLVILELTEPKNKILHWGYRLYAFKIIPFMGKLISNDPSAYEYLPASIAKAPQREEMVELMKEAGFSEAYYQTIFPGSCSVYVAVK